MNRTQISLLTAVLVAPLAFVACSGGGEGGAGDSEDPVVGSSGTSSGSTGVFTEDGATKATTPGGTSGGSGDAALLTLPNEGAAVAAQTVSAVQKTPITTGLSAVNGTSVDPENNVGLAFGYADSTVSFFNLSDAEEIAVHDTETTSTRTFSGGSATIPGAILDPAQQFAVLATGDGIEVVDYSDPENPAKLREVPSKQVDDDGDGDPTNDGVEINENIGYHPSLPVDGEEYPMVFTGGGYSGLNGEALTLVDASTGETYTPDGDTSFPDLGTAYIDAVAVDQSYNVALLAPEYDSPILVDLNRISLDSDNGTYNLPDDAIRQVADVDGDGQDDTHYTNVAIESTKHMVLLGEGYGGTRLIAAELSDPGEGLGFERAGGITMPTDTDDEGDEVDWGGSYDPHGTAAYLTAADHPEYGERVALGLWRSDVSQHIAVIDLNGVIEGVAESGSSYDPSAEEPKDMAYFTIP
ncbi:MAG: hypothetical protein ACOCUJ_00775 [Thiohalospira sp.]